MRELERHFAADRDERRYERGSLRAVRGIAELRELLGPLRRAGKRIGLVPTMGALHEGHLSLLRRARMECDVVVLTIFVNPRQFRPGEDLDSYPQQQERDLELAAAEGVDIVFAPPCEEIYPEGFRTSVTVADLTERLCGDPARRGPEHFDGVTTVVTKLFNIVGPDVAYVGQKDAQQARVIRQIASDLNFPVEIVICPTVREPDGLAMSSRNAYLAAEDRETALALHRSLKAAAQLLDATRSDSAVALAQSITAGLAELDSPAIEVEYFEIVSAEDLRPPIELVGKVLIAVAARVGGARLVDNLQVQLNNHARSGLDVPAGLKEQTEEAIHA